jgi:glycosyltransferase involved in cell wall biosynthesis
MSENFHFTGVRNDVPELMSAMDVAFYPSLHEGSPVTFIEAQIAGLPIVTGQRPEMNEAICPWVHRFALGNIADHIATAAHIVSLLADPPLRSRIAALSRDWALERYSIERSAQCLETLLYYQLAR